MCKIKTKKKYGISKFNYTIKFYNAKNVLNSCVFSNNKMKNYEINNIFK